MKQAHQLTYLISHDLTTLRYIADQVGVMYPGRLVEWGPSDVLFQETVHPYSRALIDTIPTPEPVRDRRCPEARWRSRPESSEPTAPHGCRDTAGTPHP